MLILKNNNFLFVETFIVSVPQRNNIIQDFQYKSSILPGSGCFWVSFGEWCVAPCQYQDFIKKCSHKVTPLSLSISSAQSVWAAGRGCVSLLTYMLHPITYGNAMQWVMFLMILTSQNVCCCTHTFESIKTFNYTVLQCTIEMYLSIWGLMVEQRTPKACLFPT